MASSNYTTNLHLSAWTGSDHPKRADFISDNNIIDTTLGGHIADSSVHVTAEEKAAITEPFAIRLYVGSGEEERTISLGFTPRFAIVFKRNRPFVLYNGSVNVVNCGFACNGYGGTTGVSLSSSGVVVTEATVASNGYRASLNETGSQYTIVAFR